MNDPFFRLEATGADRILANCQKDCPWSQGGFCGARIHPDCLHIGADGPVRVSLSAPAPTWFGTLARLGEVLHLSRNPVATLGCLGQVPRLEDWRNVVLPRDGEGCFTPNLAEYASLWAVRKVSPIGVLFGLEARDVSGTVFERILLAGRGRHELFEQFVTVHQSPPEEAGNWFPPNHAWSARRRASVTGRISGLRSRLVNGSKNVRPLPIRFVSTLLAAAARMNFLIRTTHYSRALIRAAVWTPRLREANTGATSPLEFFDGDGVGLHLNLQTIASVWLSVGKCACCGKELWSVEVADANDQVGLAVMSGDEAQESDWRNLINACLT